MTDNKRHPAGETQIERDLAVIRRVAARDEAMRRNHPCVGPVGGHATMPVPVDTTRGTDGWPGDEVTAIEQVVYCRSCGRHVVSEIGQTCPHCNRP